MVWMHCQSQHENKCNQVKHEQIGSEYEFLVLYLAASLFSALSIGEFLYSHCVIEVAFLSSHYSFEIANMVKYICVASSIRMVLFHGLGHTQYIHRGRMLSVRSHCVIYLDAGAQKLIFPSIAPL